MKALLAVAALAFVVVGLVFGLSPIHSGGYDCGSAFRESGDLGAQEFADTFDGGTGANGCDESRSDRLPIALAPIVLGAAAAIGFVIVAASAAKSEASAV